MPHYRKYIYSGDTLEIEEYFSIREVGKKIERGKNQNLTTAQQAEINRNRARNKAIRLVNNNFGKDDLYTVLTYRDGKLPTPEEAKRLLERFLRKVRNYRRKHGMSELKYICATHEDVRIHHNIILSGMSLDLIASFWEHGRAKVVRMDPQQDYSALVNYIVNKEKVTDEKYKKTWSHSRNLVKPKEVKKLIKKKGPITKPPKGYKIIVQDFYSSSVTGLMQYIKAVKVDGQAQRE